MRSTESAFEFHAGDHVVLATGTYQGATGVFLRLHEDVAWADIREWDGTIRCHPIAWLALDSDPGVGTRQ